MLSDLICLAAALVLALAIRCLLFEPMRVKGRSMLSTLNNGEIMLVGRAAYRMGDPARGQVVICHYPGRYMDRWKLLRQNFVKRVIGLPGETVEIVDSVVYINGVPLDEPYLDPAHTRRLTQMPPATLGERDYFVMGDNRDSSNDSRRIGPIDRKLIVGHVRWVLFPFAKRRKIV